MQLAKGKGDVMLKKINSVMILSMALSITSGLLLCGCSGDGGTDNTSANNDDTDTDTDIDIDTDTDTDTDTEETNTLTVPATCEEKSVAFAPYSDLVSVSCADGYLEVHSPTGLPDPAPENSYQKSMVGIEQWIQRIAIPYDYPWRIPMEPTWVTPYEEATSRGPIAFAVNGVPIFHYDKRPDVSTDPSLYDADSDTVKQGELDQCGGHAGQGEDYHYHYAPICLLDKHDLTQPIAYGMDGVPIYYGTGGTDYFGSGNFNDIDNLPAGDLDSCNALLLEDGSYVYYTTAEPPYTIGCHHAHVDLDLRIEPRPLIGRDQGSTSPSGGIVGEAVSTLVTDFYIDDENKYHFEHNSLSGDGTSAVIYHQVEVEGSSDCWEFEFREDADTADSVETYCRN